MLISLKSLHDILINTLKRLIFLSSIVSIFTVQSQLLASNLHSDLLDQDELTQNNLIHYSSIQGNEELLSTTIMADVLAPWISASLPRNDHLSLRSVSKGWQVFIDESVLASQTLTKLDDTSAGLQTIKNLPFRNLNLEIKKWDTQALNNLSTFISIRSLSIRRVSDKAQQQTLWKALFSLPFLDSLDVSSNYHINRNGMSEIAKLTGLTDLNIFHNQVEDRSIEPLTNLKKLVSLDIGFNEISDTAIKTISLFSNLTYLSFGKNFITNVAVEDLVKLTKLNNLNIKGTHMGVEGIEGLANFPNLTCLALSLNCFFNNQFNNQKVKELSQYTKLLSLNISLGELGDEGIKELTPLINLTSLNAEAIRKNANTPLSIAGIREIAKFINLKNLNIANNRFGDVGAGPLTNLINLTDIKTGYNEMTDAGVIIFTHLTNLIYLNIEYNLSVSINGVTTLMTLPKLKSLNITATNIRKKEKEIVAKMGIEKDIVIIRK